MLLNAVFFIALLATAAAGFLSAGLAMTRVAAIRGAQVYVNQSYQRASAAAQDTLARYMSSGGIPDPAPSMTPLPPACADARCAFTTSANVQLIALPQTASAACDTSQSSCAQNEEANPYVDERRYAARITAVVRDAGGTVVAQRSDDLLLRTIAQPPYAVPAGARDGSFDGIAASQAAGDDGGAAPATPSPCGQVSTGMSESTQIRVAYRNAVTSACSDGSAWRSGSYTFK